MTETTKPGISEDGLVWPMSFEARYGAGKDRGLVLGGGGIFFVAWQVAYLQGLAKRGVDVARADTVVGTSAGSVLASIVTAEHLNAFARKVKMLAKMPAMVGVLAPAGNLAPSQQRALTMFSQAQDAEEATIRGIGHAALAARAAPAAGMRRNVGVMLASRKWPSESLHIAAVDTYTTERLIISAHTGVAAARAAAASSSVPGLFSPQPVLDRKCMDGGVSGSGTHCDVVAGAKRVLVIALGVSMPMPTATMTIQPNNLTAEIEALNTQGSQTKLRGPHQVEIAELMSPASVPKAIAMADEQAAEDADELGAFWND